MFSSFCQKKKTKIKSDSSKPSREKFTHKFDLHSNIQCKYALCKAWAPYAWVDGSKRAGLGPQSDNIWRLQIVLNAFEELIELDWGPYLYWLSKECICWAGRLPRTGASDGEGEIQGGCVCLYTAYSQSFARRRAWAWFRREVCRRNVSRKKKAHPPPSKFWSEYWSSFLFTCSWKTAVNWG